MKTADQILTTALSTGAISNSDGKAAQALHTLALRDPRTAEQFASRQRTPLERLELALSAEGATLAGARLMTRKMMPTKTLAQVDAALFHSLGCE